MEALGRLAHGLVTAPTLALMLIVDLVFVSGRLASPNAGSRLRLSTFAERR